MLTLELIYIVYWTLLFLYLGYKDSKKAPNRKYKSTVQIFSIIILVLYIPATWLLLVMLPVSGVFMILPILLPLFLILLFISFLPFIIALMVLFGKVETNDKSKKALIILVYIHIAITVLMWVGLLSVVGLTRNKIINVQEIPKILKTLKLRSAKMVKKI